MPSRIHGGHRRPRPATTSWYTRCASWVPGLLVAQHDRTENTTQPDGATGDRQAVYEPRAVHPREW